jgi:hypothetical protein
MAFLEKGRGGSDAGAYAGASDFDSPNVIYECLLSTQSGHRLRATAPICGRGP